MDDSIESLHQKIEALDREKRQIISLVSHDIKAPLNRVFALVQLMRLEESNLTDEQHDYLDKMHLVVADGLGLIRNLADYRSLEYKNTELYLEKVNLAQVMHLALRNFQSVAAKKKITLECDAPKELLLESDHHCVIRIFENLVSNALKFSNEGTTVTISAGELNDTVFFSVQDEGPGFTPDDLKKLYGKFEKHTALPTGGESTTGLGLFIVKEMAEKIGAKVTCETEAGTGTIFTVVF
jgi:two-component system sensor histidine kinase/response regulator